MIKHGKFDTDAIALRRRIQAHEKYGSYDLNQWIFDHMELAEGLSILELGCGIGKQTLPIAHVVGKAGIVLAIDSSHEALLALAESAKQLGLDDRISLLCCGLDDLDMHLHGHAFDRVLSSYSLYYAQYPSRVLKVVHQVLKPGGIFFFCGPAKDNNVELKQFHYALQGEQVAPEKGAGIFMEESGQQLAREFFEKVEVLAFQNPLRFDSAQALYDYWSSYNLYDVKLDAAFRSAAAKHFHAYSVFETVKRVVGAKATVLKAGQQAVTADRPSARVCAARLVCDGGG